MTCNYIIKPAETESEIDGRGYVHYKSRKETYKGLVADEYLNEMTKVKKWDITL